MEGGPMKCDSCGGSGDGIKKGNGNCSVCDGTGEVCEYCGEPTEAGQNVCEECKKGEQ